MNLLLLVGDRNLSLLAWDRNMSLVRWLVIGIWCCWLVLALYTHSMPLNSSSLTSKTSHQICLFQNIYYFFRCVAALSDYCLVNDYSIIIFASGLVDIIDKLNQFLNHVGSVIWFFTTKVNALLTGASSRYTSIPWVWHWLLLEKWLFLCNSCIRTCTHQCRTESTLNHAGSVTTKVNVLQTRACSRYTMPASIARVWHWLLLGKWQYHCNIYIRTG